jgi:hypothetical protein
MIARSQRIAAMLLGNRHHVVMEPQYVCGAATWVGTKDSKQVRTRDRRLTTPTITRRNKFEQSALRPTLSNPIRENFDKDGRPHCQPNGGC